MMDLLRFFRDQDGHIIIGQSPNKPLMLAMGSYALGLVPWQPAQRLSPWLTSGALIYWAWLELTQGVNSWRRMLGALVLLW